MLFTAYLNKNVFTLTVPMLKYEKGDRVPTVENLLILAEFFHTSLDYLMDRTDMPKPYPPKTREDAETTE